MTGRHTYGIKSAMWLFLASIESDTFGNGCPAAFAPAAFERFARAGHVVGKRAIITVAGRAALAEAEREISMQRAWRDHEKGVKA